MEKQTRLHVRQSGLFLILMRLGLSGGFDLILLDLMLPGTDGFTVCRRLREGKALAQVFRVA